MRIDVKSVGASTEFVEKFGKHLVLIYTGKTRLARNLLQNVVRNWCVYVDTCIVERTTVLLVRRHVASARC